MRRLGIGYTGIKYATVSGSSTAATATMALANTLREGSLAVYGRLKSTGLMELVVTGATMSNYDNFIIMQGGNGELVQVCQFDMAEFKALRTSAYTAPTPTVKYIGYNGTSGTLNLPTIAAGDSASVELEIRDASNRQFIGLDANVFDTGSLAASASGYAVLAPIAGQLSTSQTDGINGQAANLRKANAFIVSNSTTLTDSYGTATAIKFTKGSTTASFMIEDATNGFVASTGDVTAATIVQVPHQSMRVVSFSCTANATKVIIGGTIYVVADAGSSSQNATAVAAAINAGTQASATASSAVVTITMLYGQPDAKIIAFDDNGAGTYAVLTLTVTASVDTTPVIYKAATTVAAAASFELDRPFTGETMYAFAGTSATLNTGIASVITEYGLKIVGYNAGEDILVSADGVLINSTKTTSQDASFGIGTYKEVQYLENASFFWRGGLNTTQLPAATPATKYVSATGTYDTYALEIVTNYSNASFGVGSSNEGHNTSYVTIACNRPSALAGVTGDNQKDFDDVIVAIATAAGATIIGGSLI